MPSKNRFNGSGTKKQSCYVKVLEELPTCLYQTILLICIAIEVYVQVPIDEYVMALNAKLQAFTAFEDAADIGVTSPHVGHREQGNSLQMRIAKDVLSVISVLRPKKNLS